MKKLLPFALAFGFAAAMSGASPDLLSHTWSAKWIAPTNVSLFDYGVYHFRRTFDLASKPASFVVHVTGDNRYQLFVNGERVAEGPARGDLFHWRYETVDIAPHLKAGKNVLAAVVWNFSDLAPEAQITYQTGFLLQADSKAGRIVDTDKRWKCVRDEAYAPSSGSPVGRFYFAAGPGEQVAGSKYPWGWEQPDFNDAAWPAALEGRNASPRESVDAPTHWMLVPRTIPMMEEKAEKPITVREPAGAKLAGLRVPAHSTQRFLLDQTYLTTGYPELVVDQGRDAVVSLRYAESMWLPNKRDKGNRNEIAGKVFMGYQDTFVPDGGSRRMFRPLWWRTWRYIELTIETKDQPLVLDDLRAVFSAYPFQRKARFDAGSPELQTILDVGWRTARLCAHETYMDCPYYEQLQYVGDTRIQALISLYMSGDARLMRNAIEQIDATRTAEGATYSRGPSRLQQYIPPFSLWWIGMVHDYWMYQDDPEFVRRMLPGVRAVLAFFARYQQQNGDLKPMPWWNYVDWTDQWARGIPPGSGPSDMQLLLAYEWAGDMEAALGSNSQAQQYWFESTRLKDGFRKAYWDESRKLFADNADRTKFSQQTNALAILAGVVEGDEARGVFDRIAQNDSLVQCSIYFRHYLHSAMNRVGAGDRYLDMLGQWRQMLSRGLTTWAEKADPTRSDCHAWGASPNFELFRTVLGVDSAAPGFKRVIIRPYLGKLTHVSGSIPHPKGEIAVKLALESGKLQADVQLPPGVGGSFEWKGAKRELKPGNNRLVF